MTIKMKSAKMLLLLLCINLVSNIVVKILSFSSYHWKNFCNPFILIHVGLRYIYD